MQGSGKTTASAKLALKLKNKNKKVLLVSLDIYRPAAQEQLAILAKNIGVDSLEIIKEQLPLDIVARAIKISKLSAYDVVIYDSAGRLHNDDRMIAEVVLVQNTICPTEILLVIDSMTGQDALIVASTFQEKLNISGIILSRLDGDSRGGAALSVRHVTGKPIKFLSTGEKPSDFEEFDAKRITNRILDMGDVVSLVERASEMMDQKESAQAAARFKKGQFDLNDYISQIKMIKKLGGMGNIIAMLPGMSKFADKVNESKLNAKLFLYQEAIALSMTPKERRKPLILNASRKKRIANGSGTSVQQVNILLKQFMQVSTMMKKASKMDSKSLMRAGIDKFFS